MAFSAGTGSSTRSPSRSTSPGSASPRSWHRTPGYRAVQAIDGVGPVLAGVFVAEIGQVHRFARPEQLCSWAGLTPRHRESDTKVRRGRITKQGNHLVRWAAVEAEQRGANIAKVATARKLLTLVYSGLRDGHIRCLARPA